jgi:hypothetical protein
MPSRTPTHTENEIEPVYLDLGNRYGYYSHYPGADPIIYIHEFLLAVGNEFLKRLVYQRLLEFHRSIPPDSWQRGFPFIRYFGELEACEDCPFQFEPPQTLLKEEAVMMLSTFTRSAGSELEITAWRVKLNKFRLIG